MQAADMPDMVEAMDESSPASAGEETGIQPQQHRHRDRHDRHDRHERRDGQHRHQRSQQHQQAAPQSPADPDAIGNRAEVPTHLMSATSGFAQQGGTSSPQGWDQEMDEEDRLAYQRAQATQDAAIANLSRNDSGNHRAGNSMRPGGGGGGRGDRGRDRRGRRGGRDRNRDRDRNRGGGRHSHGGGKGGPSLGPRPQSQAQSSDNEGGGGDGGHSQPPVE